MRYDAEIIATSNIMQYNKYLLKPFEILSGQVPFCPLITNVSVSPISSLVLHVRVLMTPHVFLCYTCIVPVIVYNIILGYSLIKLISMSNKFGPICYSHVIFETFLM